MKKECLDKLYEDFKVDIKPGKGSYKYVKTRFIIDRMNKTFSGNWSSSVVSSEKIGDEVLVHLTVSIMNDEGGVLAWQAGYGSAKQFQGVEIGNIYKSAKSRALKDALRNWGIALFIEDDFDSDSSETPFTTTRVPAFPTGGPSHGAAPSLSPPPGNFPNKVAQEFPKENVPASKPPTEVKSTPEVDTPFDSFPSMPPGFGTKAGESFPPAETLSKGASTTGFPSMVVPTTTTPVPSPAQDVPPTGIDAKNLMITMVQKVAIKARLESRKVSFKEYATEVFEATGRDVNTIPEDMDGLLYMDAMVMASFK